MRTNKLAAAQKSCMVEATKPLPPETCSIDPPVLCVCFFIVFDYFRSGNPLSIIGYCSLMMERNLGYTASTTNTDSTTTAATIPGHIPMAPLAAAPTTATEEPGTEAEGVAQAPEREGGGGPPAMDDADDDEEAERETVDRQAPASSTTVFRCPGRRYLSEHCQNGSVRGWWKC